MKKKIVIGNILAVGIIVLATIAPVVCAEDLNIEKKVTIKTTIYQSLDKEEILIEVPKEDAQEIKKDLEHLQLALIEGNKQLIEKYESILINKGIFGENHKTFSKNGIMNILHEKYLSMKSNKPSSLADVNRFCFVNAKGKGNLTFAFDEFFNYMIESGAILILIGVILPFLLPLLIGPALILILGGISGIFLAHLLPFRVLFPRLNMSLKTGDCSIKGLNGTQQFTAPVNAVFYWFKGLTVNFYTKDPDVFLLGFAFRSEVL